MKTIGFRAEKDAINWAVVEGPKDNPVLVDEGTIPAPRQMSEADRLAHFRKRIQGVINTHAPNVGAIKYPETFGRRGGAVSSLDARLRIEGVILEAVASAGIAITGGTWRPLASRLESDDPKAYLDSDDVRGLQFPNKDRNCREAIVAAVAALEGRSEENGD